MPDAIDSDDPLDYISDADPTTREGAAQLLGHKGGWQAELALYDALRDPASAVRAAAAEALGQRRDQDAPPRLYKALRDPDPGVRAASARALGEIADQQAVGRLRRALKDSDDDVRRAAQEAINVIGGAPETFVEPDEWQNLPGRRVIEGKELEIPNPWSVSWAELLRRPPLHADREFRKCVFTSHLGVSVTQPSLRPVVRNVRILNCVMGYSRMGPLALEDVLVDGCTTTQPVFIHGAVFKHVVLRGRLGALSLKPYVDWSFKRSDLPAIWAAANADYYANVDWALDISDAEFGELELQGIPSRLIRRDRDTSVVITRAKAAEGLRRELPREGQRWWKSAIELFLRDPLQLELVLVAPKRSRHYRQALEDIRMLRESGVAEPD